MGSPTLDNSRHSSSLMTRPRSAMESSFVSTRDGVVLHARLFKPAADDEPAAPTAVVLVHPYSKLGGCQVIMQGIASRLSIKGFTAITFDMRGVGRSTGKSSVTGIFEIEDVVAVCTWVSENLPVERILLVGSSAGAPIAGSALDQLDKVVGYVSIGYPFGFAASFLFGKHYKPTLKSRKPKLFIMGSADWFTSVRQLKSKVKSCEGRAEMHLIQGAGHFELEGPDFDSAIVNMIVSFHETL
uniref:X-pro dipeptidyl-peptidase (S15 family)-aminopeptidase activity, proteolysis n=1 Tax=Linum usitatissimum TaxID=4006 RepID=A0A165G166_LINUS|nr:x-pro dipeptidyl-peptidase (s15 family)- aminopeptidase activity, proteolysis [Linum usitatissimum]